MPVPRSSCFRWLAGAALLLGIACAWFITRSLTLPLRTAVPVAERVAGGDLTSRFETGQRDEVGQWMDALDRMNTNLACIVGQVRDGTATIAQVSGEIASGNLDLSARTEQQAGSLEETAASMEELTSTMEQIVHSIGQVTLIMNEITAPSEEQTAGIDQVNTASVEMDRVTQQNPALVAEAAAAADAMREQAGQLESVVATFRLDALAAAGTRLTPLVSRIALAA